MSLSEAEAFAAVGTSLALDVLRTPFSKDLWTGRLRSPEACWYLQGAVSIGPSSVTVLPRVTLRTRPRLEKPRSPLLAFPLLGLLLAELITVDGV